VTVFYDVEGAPGPSLLGTGEVSTHLDSEMGEFSNPNPPLWTLDPWETTTLLRAKSERLAPPQVVGE
jgi:hypothetical protein